MVRPAQLHSNILYSIIGCILFSCTQSPQKLIESRKENSSQIQLQNQKGVLHWQGQPFTGTLFALYPNQKDTLWTQQYYEGKEHGTWRKFYPEQKLQEIRYFDNGKKVNTLVGYWANGKKRYEYVFENDEYEGTCRDWNEQGLLIKEMNYHKGHEQGEQKVWYDNGKIRTNYIIKNGRRYGLLGTKNCSNVADSVAR
ncbi:MAG: toxin-antitoxin system YwqK family antitoxin [Cytophagales bacterium]|nr:MAG: toxin-antitoxin system YwqK family antitoxin [Cytophagales bacterium]